MNTWLERWGSLPARSWLFVPGTKVIEWLAPAVASGADAVIIDLEDAVRPEDKQRARGNLAEALVEPISVPCFVRVNSEPELRAADVVAAVRGGCDGIMLPKVDDPSAVVEVAAKISEALAQSGASTSQGGGQAPKTQGPIALIPLIESARGVLAAPKIAAASDRVIGLGLGGEDLAADLGVSRSAGGLELRHARGMLVLATAAAGRWAIDAPCTALDRPEQVTREATLAKQMGFAGKLAVHPRQVGPINTTFAPTAQEVAAALRVVAAAESASANGSGVITLDGRMVDEAVARAAQRVLARARPEQR